MKLRFIDTDSETFLCDRYELTDADDHDDLIAAYRRLCREHPADQILLTLDDLDQALYTSMHAVVTYSLDDTEGHDLSALAPRSFEDGEHRGYLSGKDEFPIRALNFRRQLQDRLERPIERKAGLLDDSIEEFEKANRDLTYIMDDDAFFLKIPVAFAYESVIVLPNGYFSCDLDPFEVYLLAKTMEQRFAYRLMGMGASYIAFLRDAALDGGQQDALLTLLADTFSDEFDEQLRDCIRRIVETQELLLLRYTE